MSIAGSVDALAQHASRCGGSRAAPGRNTSTEPGVGAQRPRHRVRHLPLDRRARIAAEIARLDRKGAALAFDHRRVAEQRRHARAVDGRRHHQELEILAQPLLHVARQRQPEIGIERALVEFVEQHRRDALERGIVEHHAREHALGHHLDAGLARHLRAEAHAIADGLADRFAERRRHARGRGARGEPARLQHDDLLALRPRLLAPAPAARAWSCRRPAARPARPRWRRAAPRSAPAARRRWEAAVKPSVVNAVLIHAPGTVLESVKPNATPVIRI